MKDQLGKYQIKSILGEGAMGIVYEGYDPDIKRRVAIKTLRKELMDPSYQDQDFLERFRREAQAAAQCMHPNIVTVMDFGVDDDTSYIVMEYVDGDALSVYLKQVKVLKLGQVINILTCMLKALNAAHSQGIIHRDVKPDNIMVLKDGSTKLADFGVARAGVDSDLTQVGMVIGTPKFMAPEQLVGEIVDHRADLFSLAVVFFEALKCVPKNSKIAYGHLTPIQGLPNNNKIDYTLDIPKEFVGTLQVALSAKPEERFNSAKDFFHSIKEDLIRFNLHLKANKKINSHATNPSAQKHLKNTGVDVFSNSDDKTLVDNSDRRVGSNHVSDFDTMNSLTGYGTSFSSGVNLDGFGLDLDHDTKLELRENLISIIGSSASQWVEEEMNSAITFSELVFGLGNKISNEKKRKKFIAKWSE